MALVRATLVSFNPATYLASLRLDGSAQQTLEGVAISGAIRPELLTAGRRMLVDTGASGEVGELMAYAIDGVGGGAVARAGALLDIVNSSAETSLFSAGIAANLLATDRAVRLTLIGDYLNNSGATRTLRVRVKLGATTLWDDTSIALAASATRRALAIEVLLANRGATNSQALGGRLDISALPATAGLGDFAAASIAAGAVLSGTSAEDTTTARTLDLTVQHSAANASLSVRSLYGLVELV